MSAKSGVLFTSHMVNDTLNYNVFYEKGNELAATVAKDVFSGGKWTVAEGNIDVPDNTVSRWDGSECWTEVKK